MATISNIRKNSTWVILAIGIAMLGFLISDAFERGLPTFDSSDRSLGIVHGEEIDPRVFQEKLNTAITNQKSQLQPDQTMTAEMESGINDQVWNTMVEERIMDKEYEDLGIEVSGAEIKELILGENPHPIATQFLVSDRATGKYEKDQIFKFMSNLDNAQPEQKTFWFQFENYLSRERMKEKYNSLIKSALYQTDIEGKNQFLANNQFTNFDYIGLLNNTISDSAITLTDQDYQDYITKRKDEFKRTVSRGIEFVTFDITVRNEDSLFAKDYITKQTELLRNARNDSGFVARRGYASNGFVAKGAMKEIPEGLVDQIWAADSGTVFGPTLENGIYRTIKVGGKKTDSQYVYKASHILFRPAGMSKEDTAMSQKDAMEVLKQIKGGADFATLAREKSQDPGTAQKGGDVGWFPYKQMVPEFAKAVSVANYGDVVMCKSQFGYHVIKVTGQKSNVARRIAILEKKIESGTESEKLAYNAASKFSAGLTQSDSFNTAVQKLGLNKRIVNEVKPNDKTVPGLQSSREVVRWMFDKSTKLGAISAPVSVGNQWVVAKLVKIQDEGLASIEDVKEQIKPMILAEKKKELLYKKAEEAISKAGQNLEALSKELKTNVITANNAIVMNPSLPNAGNEPMVIGYSSGMKVNAVSKPIKGNDGVFIIKLVNKANPNAPKSYEAERKNAAGMLAGKFTNEVPNVLKEQAKVKDNRFLYY